jgi:hypothetical protein
MTKPKNNEGEVKLVANVKREMNEPRLAKSARQEVGTEVEPEPESGPVKSVQN